MSRPDLSIPVLPNPDDLHPNAPIRSPLSRGALRTSQEEYEWPEAGPSRLVDHSAASHVGFADAGDHMAEAGEVGNGTHQGGIGPYQAKLIAAMTGAMATSLLSMSPFSSSSVGGEAKLEET